MSEYSAEVGDVEIISLSDGHMEFEAADIFPNVPAEAWEPYRSELTREGRVLLNVGSFVVRSDGMAVLIDTGLGEGDHGFEHASWGKLMGDMSDKGVGTDEIDIVVLTHLHRDHVGWNLVWDDDVYRPTFPRARYWIPKADWDMFTPRAGMRMFSHIRDQVTPLESLGILGFIEGRQQITETLSSWPTPGHTPGHTSFLVSSAGESAVVLGDVAHVPAQARHVEWSSKPDTNPELSHASRRDLFDWAEAENSLVASGHFPKPGFGRFERVGGNRVWRPR